jgi:hypothetical protein
MLENHSRQTLGILLDLIPQAVASVALVYCEHVVADESNKPWHLQKEVNAAGDGCSAFCITPTMKADRVNFQIDSNGTIGYQRFI